MIGSFVKTAAPQMIEIGALAGLDFVVLDSEHAPFSPADLDRGVLAGKAAGIAVVVRVPDYAGPWIQQALDIGADGVLVPHVSSADIAVTVVRAARFAAGARGFSNSPRTGGYGSTSMKEMIHCEDERVAVIVQIEDRGGVEDIRRIVNVSGVDALFLGRADLAVSYGASGPEDPKIAALAASVSALAADRGCACGTFIANSDSVDTELASGTTFFVIGSDQSVLRSGWLSSVSTFRELVQTSRHGL
jgi:2-keto-3-deoxy-L-rhamnonate aldolase RhmA